MMLCFREEAKAHYVRSRLFAGFRKWKQTAKKQAKQSAKFIKDFLAAKNSAICLHFLALPTGLWNLMDVFAFCI
jgi:hypothetical protein